MKEKNNCIIVRFRFDDETQQDFIVSYDEIRTGMRWAIRRNFNITPEFDNDRMFVSLVTEFVSKLRVVEVDNPLLPNEFTFKPFHTVSQISVVPNFLQEGSEEFLKYKELG